MVEWVPLQGGGFFTADVIRWKEGVYRPRRSRKAKALRLGDRLVIAEVLKEPDAKGWVRLLVRNSEILSELSIRKPRSLPPGRKSRGPARQLFGERASACFGAMKARGPLWRASS